jgi:hypothetical protein
LPPIGQTIGTNFYIRCAKRFFTLPKLVRARIALMQLPHISRRQGLRLAFPIAIAALGLRPAHAGYNIFTDQYTLTRAEVLSRIATRFPLSVGTPGLVDCILSHPQLGLEPELNRLRVTLDAQIRTPFLAQPVAGLLAVSTKLRFDMTTLTLRLDQPRAERVVVQGLAPADAAQLQEIGGALAAEALRDYPLHTFRPEEMRAGLRRFSVESITVTDTGLRVQLS